jgi:two-component system, NarL family, nitrate/nitrite response regulator NarL
LRIVLIGNDEDRTPVRAMLEERGIEIVAEAATLAAGRALAADADALVIAPSEWGPASAGPDRLKRVPTLDPLTPREQEVLELLAEGLSNQSIAARLAISGHTVKFHVSSICAKLGADNRTDAVRRAVRQGLITL